MRLSFLAIAAALTLLPSVAFAQESEERSATEQRLEELRDQIRQTEERLSETRELEQASMQRLGQVEREMKVREELVESYRERLRQLSAAADTIQSSVRLLEDDLTELRTQYRRRASHAYRRGRMHDVALILSASSINEMLVRVQYLRRFTDERRDKLEDIREATAELRARQEELGGTRERTRELLAEAEKERTNLAQLRQTRTRMVEELRNQSSSLEDELEDTRAAAREMEQRIQQLIAEARSRDREVVNEADRAAFAALSGSFRDNRGQLPWPARGVVTESYGEVVNPVHGTRTSNPGILITTAPAAEVHSVFEGEVLGVDAMPEFGTYVVIRHGNAYQSLYSNFSMVYVAAGDHVVAGQVIGRAGTESAPKGPGVFFGLFENGQEFDPTAWLRRQ